MYNEQLEKLIEIALIDGVLTEKEKQILFKKAESFGIDLDEFEMVLETKLYEKQQSRKKAETTVTATQKSNNFGDVKKCPSCGAIVQSVSTRCSDCSHDFNGITANNSARKLFEMLNEIEGNRSDSNDASIGKALGSFLTKTLGVEINDKINNQKKELISNFPIANTKEDIIEFLSLALPKAKKLGNFFTSGAFNTPENHRNKIHNEFVPVWQAKCQQIIMKARFAMKDDKKTLDEINYYANEIGIK